MLHILINFMICFGRNDEFKNRRSFITKKEREQQKAKLIEAIAKYK